jgi:hypothetical protein
MSKQPTVYKSGMMIESTVPTPSFPKNVIRDVPSGEGTLTCFARDEQGRPVLLSCSHVIFPGFAAVPNMRIYSPSYSTCCCSGDPIATPVFDRSKPAVSDGSKSWTGGYKDGKWFGGFNAMTCPVRGMGDAITTGVCSNSDCAIARLDPNVHFKNAWPDGTPIKGAVAAGELGAKRGPEFGTAPTSEQYVRVYSPRLKRVIYGTLLSYPERAALYQKSIPDDHDRIVHPFSMSAPDDALAGSKPAVDSFIILPRPGPNERYDEFKTLGFDHGDSGAVVINHQNLVIGMIVRAGELGSGSGHGTQLFPDDVIATTQELRFVTKIGHAALIRFALERLKITIPSDPSGWEGVVPSDGSAASRFFVPGFREDAAAAARQQGIERLRSRLLMSRRGKLLLGKIGQHRVEMRRLLASVRAITSAWRDLQGGAFLNHFLQSLDDPGHLIPSSINGVTREQLLDTLLPLFARHGSHGLRRDIERYRTWATAAIVSITSLDDLAASVSHRSSI